MGTVLLALSPKAGESLAVFGAGPVGLAGVIAGVIAGCSTIIAVDMRPEHLALARSVGATHVIDAAGGGAVDLIRSITGGGVNCAFETTGVPVVAAQALSCLRKRGRTAYVGGAPAGTIYCIDANVLLNSGASIRGVVEGDAVPADFIPTMIGHYRAGRLPLEKLVTAYPFERINEAIRDMENGKTAKAVLTMDPASLTAAKGGTMTPVGSADKPVRSK
jgi:aryl-alcohol dehydrogenase